VKLSDLTEPQPDSDQGEVAAVYQEQGVSRSPTAHESRVANHGSRITYHASFLKAVWAVVWKDLAAEMRSRELISAMLVFALLVILIFNFALELDAQARSTVTAGVLWVTFAFAGTLGLNRSMAMEKDRGCLDGLLLAPVDRSAIYFGKMIGNLLFMLIVEAIVLPVYSILYNTNLFMPGLVAVILLGSLGYVVVGTLLSSMAVQTRTRDVLLPILLLSSRLWPGWFSILWWKNETET
jgi:heme exporter protein B